LIFVTVGTQLPFDRLVRAVDAWCGESGRRDVIGQIGDVGQRGYRPANFEWSPFVSPRVLDDLMKRADLIIAHAGMGSIISALRYAKPIVVMPRRAAFGEHRNDHQSATVSRFASRAGIYVANDESQLRATVERATEVSSLHALSAFAEPGLIRSLRQYILTGTAHAGTDDPELDSDLATDSASFD
jgi:UDP-N-acetylglucosamine transferase subunit ALG13